MNKMLSFFVNNLKLYWQALLEACPLFFKLLKQLLTHLKAICARMGLSERERRRSDKHCVPINEPAYKRPDPLIYSQRYLMKQGLAVTWDNPDIQLMQGGMPISSADLKPDTDYEVVSRIWNNSTSAPVVNLPVHLSVMGFGIGTQPLLIGTDKVNLGVKGGVNHPAFSKHSWRTPKQAGHYCLQVQLDWLDDANPANNLGQENTNVGELHSPAHFNFMLHNEHHERLPYRFAVDAYVIPKRQPCRPAGHGEPKTARDTSQHTRENHPLPTGWQVLFDPAEPLLAAGETRNIAVTVIAPDGYKGRQAVNVHAFTRYGLAGGVTLYVEGK